MRVQFLCYGVTLVVALAVLPGPSTAEDGLVEWRHFGSDRANTKYSPLDVINAENVAELRLAWTWDVSEVEEPPGQPTRFFRTTPLMAKGKLYLSTGLQLVVSLDAATGRRIWSFDPKAYEFPTPTHGGLGGRGIEYWSDESEERIILVTGGLQLIALDARTGRPIENFGRNGAVDLSEGLGRSIRRGAYNIRGPATVCRDTIVFGNVVNDLTTLKSTPPGHVRGYDVRTGELKWVFHTIPQAGEFGVDTWEDESWKYTGNTNVWSWISADEELGYFYLPIGTATNDWYGGHRPGNNLFAESLVCLNADTGERIWHFQAVHHGIWDYDFPAAPTLVDIVIDGKPVRAVAQVSKQAFTYVFDRLTGEPIWPIEERAVPQSSVPGERTSPSQPFPTKPPAFDRQGVSLDDLVDFTPELRAKAEEILKDYEYGPLFTPPIVAGQGGKKGTLHVPGIVGGASWPGGGFDPETGYLFVQSATRPWVLALKPGDKNLSDLDYMFKDWAAFPPNVEGLPLLKPPYARITAIDLNRGEIVWQAPLGEGPRRKVNALLGDGTDVGPLGSTNTTTPYNNGPLVTKSLLFVNQANGEEEIEAGHPAGVMRAFDKQTGAAVWQQDIDSAPNGLPMTYLHEGKQYMCFTASRWVDGKVRFELLAYTLP